MMIINFFRRIINWFEENPCYLSHSDGEIVEYGEIKCVKKCDRCGDYYMWP